MQMHRVLRHRTWLASIGGIILLASLLFFVEGVHSIVIGFSPAAQNSSVNFAVFGGTVFVAVSALGVVVGGFLARWKRTLRCAACNYVSDAR
jgi:hypothetical protein